MRNGMAMKIGITGGIGSGKSFVCKLLKERGIVVYDCDDAAKRLMRTSPTLRCQLTKLIGLDTYVHSEDDVWTLNKAVVARFLLESATNAKAIDAIVHPAVFSDFEQSGLDWMESAILYESGADRLVDRVIVVTAPEDIRIKRVMQRDKITEAKAREWIARQWSQDEVSRRADYEIVNDGQQELQPQISKILAKLSPCP